MAIRNNALSMYQDQKKKNSLQPYIDVGNASTEPKTSATRVSPTYTQNTVAKAYSAPKTASTVAPLQSAVAKAYNQPAQQSVPAQTAQNVPKATASMTTPTQNTNTPTLQQAYGNTGSYGSARQNALNQAEASYNKLLNYLPEYSELLGMRGLGVSNQALLNAYGTYQQNVNDINAQYDELERAYRDQQITNATNISGELSAYISNAGNDFTLENYEKFKQGLLDAGYTEQEIAAGEMMLDQNSINVISKKTDPVYLGKKSLEINIKDASNNKLNGKISFENAYELSSEQQAGMSQEAQRRGIEVKDGAAFNILNTVVFYYNGEWHMIPIENVEFIE